MYDENAGNPALSVERSNNYEVGVEKGFIDSRIGLTAFLIDVTDYIEKIPPDDIFMNNDKYRFSGFEVTGETRLISDLMLKAGYTFMYTRDKSGQYDRDELQYRPEHKFTIQVKYDFDYGFSAYMSLLYIADQVYYSDVTPALKRELNDYTIVNLKLDKKLINDKLDLYLVVDNLFDKDYEQSLGFPQSGRMIYGGVSFRF